MYVCVPMYVTMLASSTICRFSQGRSITIKNYKYGMEKDKKLCIQLFTILDLSLRRCNPYLANMHKLANVSVILSGNF